MYESAELSQVWLLAINLLVPSIQRSKVSVVFANFQFDVVSNAIFTV